MHDSYHCIRCVTHGNLSLWMDRWMCSNSDLELFLSLSSPSEYDNKEYTHFKKASSAQISLTGPSEESINEAKQWLTDLFTSSHTINICNQFILHLGEKEHLQLSRLTTKGVKFKESLTKGHASLTVDGNSFEDVVIAAIQLEAMLCNVQTEFVREEDNKMCLLANEAPLERERKTRTVDDTSKEFRDRCSAFKHEGLIILKVQYKLTCFFI